MSTIKKNEKGAALVLVLLVILIFSVLGLSLMGNVISEDKRVNKTDSNLQERNLVRDGLTYFAADFKKYVKDHSPDSLNLNSFNDFLNQNGYKEGKTVEQEGFAISTDAKITDSVQTFDKDTVEDQQTVTVFSQDESSSKTLNGHYKVDYDIDMNNRSYPFTQIDPEGIMVNFEDDASVLSTDLLSLASLGLITTSGTDDKFYPVPTDGRFLDTNLNLLFKLIGLNLDLLGAITDLISEINDLISQLLLFFTQLLQGDLTAKENELDIKENELNNALNSNRFQMMEENSVIATRKGSFLTANILEMKDTSLVSLSLLDFPAEPNTNVNIDGYYTNLKLTLLGHLGIDLFPGYQDIHFKKLAVIGNALIHQDKELLDNEKKEFGFGVDLADERTFSFKNGLFVKNSLIIGGTQEVAPMLDPYSHLNLYGDMAIMDDLLIQDADIEFINNGDGTIKGSNIYVQQNATIQNSCIHATDHFGLFAKGKITIENNTSSSECQTQDGIFYAEDGIVIDTNNQDITINGALIGDIEVIGTGTVTINQDPDYLATIKVDGIELIPQGRSFEKP